MVRVVKSAEARRNEIMDTAYRLFIRLGYDGTTVSTIIEELGLSKGAFYHHFASKEEVLHALAARMAEQMRARFEPFLARHDLSAVEKLRGLFGLGTQFKKDHAPMVRTLTKLFFREENILLRRRMVAESITFLGPVFARILDDGNRDGTFDIDDPVETARLAIHLGTFLHDVFGDAVKRAQTDMPGAMAQLLRSVAAYERALEAILGLPRHSLALATDREALAMFLEPEKP